MQWSITMDLTYAYSCISAYTNAKPCAVSWSDWRVASGPNHNWHCLAFRYGLSTIHCFTLHLNSMDPRSMTKNLHTISIPDAIHSLESAPPLITLSPFHQLAHRTLSLCESTEASGHSVLRSHNMTFPSNEDDIRWNQELGCHLQAVIQLEWEENWNTGANVPGLRGSHTLRTGSEPPAAINEEPSPPQSKKFKAFHKTYSMFLSLFVHPTAEQNDPKMLNISFVAQAR